MIIDKIISAISGKAGEAISSTVDKLSTSDEEKSEAKKALSEVVLNAVNEALKAQVEVLKAEMSGNWLQKSWRPIVMLTFTALLVIRWTGLTSHNIDLALELELMAIIKLGLGGYVVGRSVEKVAGTVTKNIDLPFIKKKNR